MRASVRFTKRKLEAIEEALAFRTAGEIERYSEEDPTHDDYEAAGVKVARRLAAMGRRRPAP